MKIKFLIASALVLLAMAFPAMAGTAVSIDFESPYTVGSVFGQADWWSWISGNASVSAAAPIGGSGQSMISVGGVAIKPLDLYDKSTISWDTKVVAGGYSDVYIIRAGSPNGLGWIVLTTDGVSFNMDGGGMPVPANLGTHYVNTGALLADHVYKTTFKFNFSSLSVHLNLYDVAAPGTVWTYDAEIGGDIVPGNIAGIGFANWGSAPVTYDNLNMSETVPEPGSFVALASGLIGLAGFVIRRRK